MFGRRSRSHDFFRDYDQEGTFIIPPPIKKEPAAPETAPSDESLVPEVVDEPVVKADPFTEDEAFADRVTELPPTNEELIPPVVIEEPVVVVDIDEPVVPVVEAEPVVMDEPTVEDQPAAEAEAPAVEPTKSAPKKTKKAAKKPRRKFHVALWDSLVGMIPHRGDPPRELVRKSLFVLASLVLVASLSYIVSYEVISPMVTQSTYEGLESIYNNPGDGSAPEVSTDSSEEGTYYPPIVKDFTELLKINDQVQGWLSYSAFDMEYPITYSGDNDFYLDYDFYKRWNANGCLFFDQATPFSSADSYNRVAIIYGHNMNSGLMLAKLNRLYNNLDSMKSATMFTVNTLYEQNVYKVFAVAVIDDYFAEGEDLSAYFNYRRTSFSSDTDFLRFISRIQARSMYDIPVDMNAGDEIMILSTCTNEWETKLKDGRLAVFARKVREGESLSVDAAGITMNSDVIMPLEWYTKRGETPHAYYTDENYTIPTIPNTTTPPSTTTTTPSETPTTTTTTPPSDTTTTPSDTTTTPSDTTTSPSDTTTSPSDTTASSESPTTTTTSSDTTAPTTTTTTAKPITTTKPTTTTTAKPTTTTTTTAKPTTKPTTTTTAKPTTTTTTAKPTTPPTEPSTEPVSEPPVEPVSEATE